MNEIAMIDLSMLMAIVGVLVFIVNIVTEVIKKVLPEKFPTQLFVMVLSIVVTVCVFIAYCDFKSIEVVWYMVLASVVVGFMVAYAAMFGFDTLKDMVGKLKG